MPEGTPHTRVIRQDGRPTSIEFMRCTLAVVAGPEAGKQLILDSSRITIGSAVGCQLVLADPTVSRIHCEIEVGEGGFLLRDLDSTNGTLVNGLRVREIFLEPGSAFAIGDSRLELRPSNDRVEIRLSEADRFGGAIGRSIKMREVFFVLEKTAPKDVTVLLIGETGTGKDVLARAIHEASPRAEGPFVALDCGCLPESLAESELFGHAKGAFTGATADRAGVFEAAQGGTLFLDEIGELPPAHQAKLLRALETREIKRVGDNVPRPVNVRVVAATSRNLAEEVAAGSFRKDLFYRLSVVSVSVPPLRERIEDIPLLAEHFLTTLFQRSGQPAPSVSLDALSSLAGHPWPGNVRELRNVLEQAAALTEEGKVDAATVALAAFRNHPQVAGAKPASGALSYSEAHDRFERDYLLLLLRANDMNVSQAARAAGIHRQTIHRLLRKHGIRPER